MLRGLLKPWRTETGETGEGGINGSQSGAWRSLVGLILAMTWPVASSGRLQASEPKALTNAALIQRSAEEDFFALAPITMSNLNRLVLERTPAGRHVVQGVLTHQYREHLFLRDSTGSIEARSAMAVSFRRGSRITASGFVGRRRGRALMREARFRHEGKADEPQAKRVDLSQATNLENEAELIVTQGDLWEFKKGPRRQTLILKDEDFLMEASLDLDVGEEGFDDFDLGSRVQVTGICWSDNGGDLATQYPRLLLRSNQDVMVLSKGVIVKPQQITAFLVTASGILAAIFFWAMTLRWRLRQQTRRIRSQLQREMALEERHRELVENANDIIYSHDLEGKITSINRAAEKLMGYSRDEMMHMHLANLIDPKQRGLFEEAVKRLGTGERPEPFEMRVRSKNGRWHTMEVNPLSQYRDGEIREIGGLARDISDRKLAEQKLRESEEKYRLVVENATEAMALVDRDGRFLMMNQAGARFFGGAPGDYLGRTMWEIFSRSVADRQMVDILKVMESNTGVSIERAVITQGQERWFSSRIEPVNLGAFKDCALIVARDITDRVKMETALRQNEAALQRSQHIGKVGSWELDLVTSQLFWSTEMYRILSCPSSVSQPSMETLYAAIHPQDRDLLRAGIARAVADGSVINMDLRLQVSGQQERTINVQAQVARDKSNQPVSIAGTVQDVSERRTLEQQLRQAQKMEAIGQLAGGIAHDFNNVLTVVMGQIELLLAKTALDSQTKRRLVEAQVSAQKASQLTRQLLTFSRRQALQRRVLDLNELSANMTHMLRRVLGEHITLSYQYAPDLPTVLVDPGMMEQVLLNLAVNARDAMPDGGKLMIKTRSVRFAKGHPSVNPQVRLGRFVCWIVQDTGCGMDDRVRQRIFEPFYTTKEAGKGSGMGLAMVYGIIQQHQGWIGVVSQPGKGTAFRIFLPAAERPKETPAAQACVGSTLPRGSETVLVVEDEPSLRELERTVLEQLGYRVIEAGNGTEALAAWTAEPQGIDLLVTDMVMPGGMTGRDLAQQLLAMKPSLKVVYTTGYSLDLTAHPLALKEGINFLPKPFGPSKLAQTVRNCLDLR